MAMGGGANRRSITPPPEHSATRIRSGRHADQRGGRAEETKEESAKEAMPQTNSTAKYPVRVSRNGCLL